MFTHDFIFFKGFRDVLRSSFVDSSPIRECKDKRISRIKVFKGIALTGKSKMGCFHGFKLYSIINDKGELLSFAVTQANVDKREH